tara:strand:+ start:51618 stop:51986 length:369 start_codon:yes stop_codon:yes gene_type:complete
MPMHIQFVEGQPPIEKVRNQAAVKRGPLVYCIETPDIPEQSGILDMYIGSDSDLKANYSDDVLGGMTTISADLLVRKDSTHEMYNKIVKPQWDAIRTEFVPYYAWSNRGTAEMTVFLPIIWK